MSYHDFHHQISLKVADRNKAADDARHLAMLRALDPAQQADEVFAALLHAMDETIFAHNECFAIINGRTFSDDHPTRTIFLRSVFARFMVIVPDTEQPTITLRRGDEILVVKHHFYVNVSRSSEFFKVASEVQAQAFLRALSERLDAARRDTLAEFEATPCMVAARRVAAMHFSSVPSIYRLETAENFNAAYRYGLDGHALSLMRFFHAWIFEHLYAHHSAGPDFHLTLHMTKTQYDDLLPIRGTLRDIGMRLVHEDLYAADRVNYNEQGLLDLERGKAIRRAKRAQYAANAATRKKK